jgi:hypothetical protein
MDFADKASIHADLLFNAIRSMVSSLRKVPHSRHWHDRHTMWLPRGSDAGRAMSVRSKYRVRRVDLQDGHSDFVILFIK